MKQTKLRLSPMKFRTTLAFLGAITSVQSPVALAEVGQPLRICTGVHAEDSSLGIRVELFKRLSGRRGPLGSPLHLARVEVRREGEVPQEWYFEVSMALGINGSFYSSPQGTEEALRFYIGSTGSRKDSVTFGEFKGTELSCSA